MKIVDFSANSSNFLTQNVSNSSVETVNCHYDQLTQVDTDYYYYCGWQTMVGDDNVPKNMCIK